MLEVYYLLYYCIYIWANETNFNWSIIKHYFFPNLVTACTNMDYLNRCRSKISIKGGKYNNNSKRLFNLTCTQYECRYHRYCPHPLPPKDYAPPSRILSARKLATTFHRMRRWCGYTAISIKVVHEQSGKVEYESERLLGTALKIH
jgi:hypothetical protein